MKAGDMTIKEPVRGYSVVIWIGVIITCLGIINVFYSTFYRPQDLVGNLAPILLGGLVWIAGSIMGTKIIRHKCSYRDWEIFEHAPVKGGGHTMYHLMLCAGCMTAVTFPESNYLLTTDEHKKEIEKELMKQGVTLSLVGR